MSSNHHSEVHGCPKSPTRKRRDCRSPPEVLEMIRDGRINPTNGLFDANGERLDFAEEE